MRRVNSLGADDYPADTRVEIRLDCIFTANPSAHLDRHIGMISNDVGDQTIVNRSTSHSAVEVDDMQTSRPLFDPLVSYRNRVFGENRFIVHPPLT